MAKCQEGPSFEALVNVGVVKVDLPKKTSFMVNLGSQYVKEERATCETISIGKSGKHLRNLKRARGVR